MFFLFFLLQISASDEFREYISIFKDADNPVYNSFLFILLVFVIFFVAVRYIFIPLQRKHKAEEEKLKIQNLQLMVLFADMDPDPVLRINETGKLIFINPAAKRDGFDIYQSKDIRNIFPEINLDINELIKKDDSMVFYSVFKNRNYSINFMGISNLGIAQLYLTDITQFKLNQLALEKARQESKDFSVRLQKSIEDERKKISRELHDVVGHDLIVLQLVLQKKFYQLTGNENSADFIECVEVLDKAVKDLKSVAYSMRTGMYDENSLKLVLYSLIETLKKQKDVAAELECDTFTERLNENIETAIYRIAQEAVNNSIKYSHSTEVRIMLKNKGDFVRLVVTDNGIGFNLQKLQNEHGKGMGVKNMRERAESHNGFFNITSVENQGTMIVAEFPLEKKNADK